MINELIGLKRENFRGIIAVFTSSSWGGFIVGNIILILLVVAISYFIIYGISKIIATVFASFKAAWLVLLIGAVAIIYYFFKASILNIAIVAIAAILFGIITVKKFIIRSEESSGKVRVNKSEYREAIRKAYACLYTFLIYGTLYVNISYIFSVLIAGVSLDEYKEMGILNGFVTSQLGLGPIKWFFLALAAISLIRAYIVVRDLDIACTEKPKKSPPPVTTVGNYYQKMLGIKIAPKEDTVDAVRQSLQDYFFLIVEDEEKRNKLVEAIMNAAAFETTDYEELLNDLSRDTGMDQKELLTYLPQLGD